jgi:hypothetical protein
MVRQSFKPETYAPHASAEWEVAYQKLEKLMPEA